MCGIAGYRRLSRGAEPPDLERMTGLLAHRGPDDRGLWTDPEVGLGFGHRRLAVIDPRPGGRQPMVSACGRWVLVYNGEVYNFKDIRKEIESHYLENPNDLHQFNDSTTKQLNLLNPCTP